MKSRTKWVVGALSTIPLAVAAVGGAFAEQRGAPPGGAGKQADAPRVEPEADAILRRMSDYMSSLRAFSFDADHTIEVVTKDGQKIEFGAASQVQVERPNHLRSDRRGEVADLSFYYDGKTVTLLGRGRNLYATAPAPENLDAAIDFTRDRLDIDAPAADLLYSNPYAALMEDVVSGRYLGTAEMNGMKCHHLAYRGNETDWQLWVQDGAQPHPCKFVIVSKKVAGAPEFAVEVRRFQVADDIPDSAFQFEPPKDATKIDFLGLQGPATPGSKGGGR